MEQEASHQEISVSEVLQRMWRHRGLFFILPILFAAITLAGLAIWSIQLRNPIVYYVGLKGIQDGRYPNGAQFSPNDLLIPQVIEAVASQFAIQDQAALRAAFQIRSGSPLEEGVNAKYRKLFANRALTTTENDALASRYKEELSQAVNSGIRIDFNFRSLGLDKAMGMAVAAALPEAWTKIYPRLFKVVLDTRLQDVGVSKTVTELNDTSSLLFANQAINNLRRGLSIIIEDDRLNSIATRDGNNGASLMQDLDRFSTLYFDPLFHSVKANDPVSETYVRQVEFEVANQQRQLAGFSETIRDLQNFRNTKRDLSGAPSDASSVNTAGVQLNESGINEIAGLVERATLADYLKGVLDKRQEKLVRISVLQKELAVLNSPLPAGMDAAFATAATQQFKTIVDEYTELLALARQRLSETLGTLYVPVSSPAVVGSAFPSRSLLYLGLSILAGLLSAGAISLLRETISKGGRDKMPKLIAISKKA